METRKTDVIIVGAGPAGCAAAYDLAGHGLDVQLLDKASFPRLKPCAGGLTIKTLKALRYSVAPVVQRVCSQFHIGYQLQKVHRLRSKAPLTLMTERAEFDAYNLDRCIEAGVQFSQIKPIGDIERKNGLWKVTAGGGAYQGRWLIGADGANSCVRRFLFPDLNVKFAVAAETCLTVPNPDTFEMEMNFGYVSGGYAWIFPKGNHLNVGIYAMSALRGIKKVLVRFCRERLQIALDPSTIVGHRIPYNGHQFAPHENSAFLVGDAAGLADPFFGEGIYNAVRSGQIAAAAVIARTAGHEDSYPKSIQEITKDLKSYWPFTKFYYRHLRMGYRLLCSPPVRYWLIKGAALGWPIVRVRREFLLLPFHKPEEKWGQVPLGHP